jgi:uncharacterized protein (DUF2147 family)
VSAASALLLVAALASGGPAASVSGLWRTPVDQGTVRIAPCPAGLCGHVEGSTRLNADPGQRDLRNRDPALRGRLIKGLLILELHAKGDGRWDDGWVYDPERGQSFKASARVDGGRFLLTGCLAALLCQTQSWTRVR